MEWLEQVGEWIRENEALFSGSAALVALVALVPAALRPLWRRRQRGSDPDGTSSAVPLATRTDGPPRLAVLPTNTSGSDSPLRDTAEFVWNELTALLARTDCEVISHRSSSAFQESGHATREAATELGVDYVVESELRKDETHLRIRISLIDTYEDRVAWTDAFSVDEQEAERVAERIAQRLAAHLGVELTRAEIGRVRRRDRDPEARDLYLEAQGLLFDEGHSKASYERALELLERAIETDPRYADAHAQLGLLLALGHVFGFVPEDERSRARAMKACERAVELDDRSSDVLGYAGCAYCDLQLYEQGVPLLDRAIAANPSNTQAHAALGTAYVGMRKPEEGARHLEEALRLTPAYKGIAPWATVLAGAYLRLGRLEEAGAALQNALGCDPRFFPAHLSSATLALLEQDSDRAERHVREAKRLNPELDAESISAIAGRRLGEQLSLWLD